MRLQAEDGSTLELHLHYEFRRRWRPPNPYEWLVITGTISSPDGRWRIADQPVTTVEAGRLSCFFRQAANGAELVEPLPRDERIWRFPMFALAAFTLDVAEYRAGLTRIRAYFCDECLPPWEELFGREGHMVSYEFDVPTSELVTAAGDWDSERARYPVRKESRFFGSLRRERA